MEQYHYIVMFYNKNKHGIQKIKAFKNYNKTFYSKEEVVEDVKELLIELKYDGYIIQDSIIVHAH